VNCKQIQKKLDQWLTGELSSESAQRVELHLAQCAECAAELRFRQRTAEQMSGNAVPDSAMRYRLETEMDAIDAGTYGRRTWTSLGVSTMKKAVWPVTAAMVAVATYVVVTPQGAL